MCVLVSDVRATKNPSWMTICNDDHDDDDEHDDVDDDGLNGPLCVASCKLQVAASSKWFDLQEKAQKQEQ